MTETDTSVEECTMYTLLTTALLATAPIAADPAAERFDSARDKEAQRTMLTTFATTRETVSRMYNWASSSVTLDRPLTQQHAHEVSRQLATAETAWNEMVKGLSAEETRKVNAEATAIRDAFARGTTAAARLKTEASATSPNRIEVRHLTSEIYTALALAHEQQVVIGTKLGITPDQSPKTRAR